MVRLSSQGTLIDLEVIALDEHPIGRQKVSYRPFQARVRGYAFMGPPHLCFFPPFPGEVLSSGKDLGSSLLSASSFEDDLLHAVQLSWNRDNGCILE